LATEFNEPINDEKYFGLCSDATPTQQLYSYSFVALHVLWFMLL